MANNLKDHLKEVADAIRAKKGTSDLINPQDFATEIEGISGGGESASTIEYLDVSGLDNENYLPSLLQVSVSVKAKISNGQMEGTEVVGMTMAMFALMSSNVRDIKSVCIDFTSIVSQKMGDEVQSITIENMLVSLGVVTKEQLDAIPRLTKEQFYDLNA